MTADQLPESPSAAFVPAEPTLPAAADIALPVHDGSDLAALRHGIDELKNTPIDQLIDPEPPAMRGFHGDPTNAID